MNLQQLRYAVEIERTGSITKAAQNLYMGQPNLSKAVRDLEGETGITIFRRTRKGVEPTEPGREFLSYARTILSQMDELESLYRTHDENVRKLSVSVPRATYIAAAFARCLSGLGQELPLSVHFKETSSMGALSDISSDEAGLAIIRVQDTHEQYYQNLIREAGLAQELLWEFHMVLLMSKNHPLARIGREIPYHRLDGGTEIILGDPQGPSLTMSQISRNARMQKEKRMIYVYERGSQYDFLRRVAGTYMWVSPIPREALEENGMVLRSCPSSDRVYRDIIVYRKGRELSAEEQGFVEAAREMAAEMERQAGEI